jgi:hypothetical protein
MLLSRQVIPVFLVVLTAGAGQRFASSQTLFTTSGIHPLEHWVLTADGAVLAKSVDGEAINVGPPEAALLDIPDAREFAPSYPLAYFQNGEILAGKTSPGEATDEVTLVSEQFGEVNARLDELIEIRYSGIEPERVTAPCVVLSNGDVVAGKIIAILRDRVIVDSVFGETPLDRRVIGRLVFASKVESIDGRAGNQFLLVLSDGQRVYADAVSGDPVGEAVRVIRARREGRIPKTKIQRIIFPGWKYDFLSRRPYEIVEAVPYFDGPVEVRKDQNALGGPLWLGGRWFEHGFGTRPRSRIRVELNGEWNFVSGWVGLDDHAGKSGNASTRLIADGEILYASDEVVGGANPGRIRAHFEGVQNLELFTDFGKRGHIGDFINWCDMILVGRQ